MPKATQLTLSRQNRPGMPADIAKLLGDAKMNILAYLTTTSGSEGLTHLIVTMQTKPKGRLRALGLVTPRQMCSTLNSRIGLERWRRSPACSPRKTST
jgi:hypothetical protein